MRKWMATGTAALAAFTTSATAAVIDTSSPWLYATWGWLGTAQTFIAPSDNVLQNWTFFLSAREGDGNVQFSVYEWSGAGPAGAALYSTNLAWMSEGGAITASGIQLALTPGSLYGVVIDLPVYDNVSLFYTADEYAGGNAFWTNSPPTDDYTASPEFDHLFIAEFSSGIASVPEPGALALLGLGMTGLALTRRRSG